MKTRIPHILGSTALVLAVGTASADQVILDDLIVDGSICVGVDCSNGESFGFDTIRLKENNLRIRFMDTSTSGSFPTNDWQITANDSSNGGANKFSIDDIDAGRTPFTILATAPSNSIFVDAAGDVGLGNGNPIVELHITDGDSPTVRLEQNGSSGFTAQTFDIAANETNFFVRDVTNGSQLPFKIFPGADHNALVVAADNDVGMGIQNPTAPLHVVRSAGAAVDMLRLQNNDGVTIRLADTSANGAEWSVQSNDSTFRLATALVTGPELELTEQGDMELGGACITFNANSGSPISCSFAVGGPTCTAAATCP